MSTELDAESPQNTRNVSHENKIISNVETNEKSDDVKHISTTRQVSRASNSPPFFTLINELRRRFPVNKNTESKIKINQGQICHETGERLSENEVGRNVTTLRKQKGVSFSPQTLALDAVMESSAEDLEDSLIEGLIDINELDGNGDTLLHHAAEEGDIDCIRVLVKHGANVNIKNKEGWPPIHLALRHANISAMVYLIECGSDMEEYTKLRVEEFKKAEEISKQVYKEEEVFV